MASRFFLSMTAFSLVTCAFSYSATTREGQCDGDSCALEIEEEQDLPSKESDLSTTNEKKPRLVFPKKVAPVATEESVEKQALPKRMKPHFAGVRRVPEDPAKPVVKKTKKVKNEWFSSKTQPKNDKKATVAIQEESAELPDDRPYFIKTNNAISLQHVASNDASISQDSSPRSEPEGYRYPKTGFLAPQGHVIVTADWLYWRTRQEGMEFATSKQIEFDYQSGFRVGVGAHLPDFDGWTIYTNYTRFIPESSSHAHGLFYPLFLFQGDSVTEAKGHWKVKFQSADLAFGKAYYLTKTLVFSPFFGLKGAWIDQHAHFRYEGGTIPTGQTFHTHFKNEVKGAGPLIGVQMNWQLGLGFCFFSDIATALVACHFDNGQEQYQLDGQQVIHLDTTFNQVSPFLGLVAGVAWDRNFHSDKCHFGLNLGFEAQQWWNQNQTEQFVSSSLPLYVRQRGDLSFYGLTLRARVDF